MTTDIKERKQLTHLKHKDGSILVSEKSVSDINQYLKNNSHIMIEGRLVNKYDVMDVYDAKLDDLEYFILSQDKPTQEKLRKKRDRLKQYMGNDMTYKYALHYVNVVL